MRYYNIPVFVPHYGCPFDCVFCNQKHITGEMEKASGERTTEIIKEHLATIPKTETMVETAFFGGSFTAVEEALQIELLSSAYEFVKRGEIDGIRLSTRPDFIDDGILQRLVSFGVTTIELGVQSMDDEVLSQSGRGHTAEDVKNAVRIIKKYPVKLGLQMMTGLPSDTDEKALRTADEIILQKPDFVRIYPTLVLCDTRLCQMYESGEYKPQELDDAVGLCAKLIQKFTDNNIGVIRTGLAVTEEISPNGKLVAGPFHSAFGELSEGEIFYEKMLLGIKNAKEATFLVNPRDISKAIGNKGRNTKRLKAMGIRAEFIQDENVPLGTIKRKE